MHSLGHVKTFLWKILKEYICSENICILCAFSLKILVYLKYVTKLKDAAI